MPLNDLPQTLDFVEGQLLTWVKLEKPHRLAIIRNADVGSRVLLNGYFNSLSARFPFSEDATIAIIGDKWIHRTDPTQRVKNVLELSSGSSQLDPTAIRASSLDSTNLRVNKSEKVCARS